MKGRAQVGKLHPSAMKGRAQVGKLHQSAMKGRAQVGIQYPPAKRVKAEPSSVPIKKEKIVNTSVGGIIGEVRFDDPDAALSAAAALNGSDMGGSIITVEMDARSKDSSKLKVSGIPPGAAWQELKDHFAPFGVVAFADVKHRNDQTPVTGVVRFQNAEIAELAMSMMNGAEIEGNQIEVKFHSGSKDATKLMVFGLPPSFEWQELKDFAAQCGPVEYADVVADGISGGAVGEIRYDDVDHVQIAIDTLNGSTLGDAQIEVVADPHSKDGSKLIVRNLPSGIEWQELKDHFKTIGTVAHANVKGGGVKGGAMAGMMGGMMGGALGEIRYDDVDHVEIAIATLNGSTLGGAQIEVVRDPHSKDGSKLIVRNLPPGMQWQELKDHFKTIGTVAHANVKGGGVKGGAMAGMMGGMMGGMMPAMMGGAVGEVRYDNPFHAQMAIAALNGSILGGAPIAVTPDPSSSDGSKVIVWNIPEGIEWQELKDHFKTIGQVAHANVKGRGSKGGAKKGFGACGGKGMMMAPMMMAPGKGMGRKNKGMCNPAMMQMNPAMMQMAMMGGAMW